MNGKLSGIIVLLLIISGGLLTACNQSQEPDQVTVQLSWFHSAEYAGFYVADQQGYYADENLAVTLVAGTPEVDPVAEVFGGQAQFGITTGEGIIRARAAGQDVVAVASIFRQSPLVVMTLPESNIEEPQDLVGKRVGVVSPNLDTTWDIQLLAMFNKLGLDRSSIEFVPLEDYHGANELLTGRIDAHSSAFSTTEPVQARLDGYPTELMFLSDYGVAMYVNPVFTTGQLVQDRPELVERFVRATLKGYRYAIEHPEEAGNLALAYDESLNSPFQIEIMKAEIPLIDTGDAPIGMMDEAVWQVTQNILMEQGLIDSSVDLSTVYTNQFVQRSQ